MKMFTKIQSNIMNRDTGSKSKMFGKNIMLASTFSVLALLGANNVIAKQDVGNSDASNYAYKVLLNTEAAINNFDDNPKQSLIHVKNSLDLIDKIESSFEQKTKTDVDDALSIGEATAYTHFLPKLNVGELRDNQDMPTLKRKINEEIVYSGNVDSQIQASDAWFDYTFARASLVTVREAINADHDVEAMSNLKRVFEAVYIAPDFNVSDQS